MLGMTHHPVITTTQIEEGALVTSETNGSTGGDLFVAALGFATYRWPGMITILSKPSLTPSGITGIGSVVNLAVGSFR